MEAYFQAFAVFVSDLSSAIQFLIDWYGNVVRPKYTATFFLSRQSIITRCADERVTAHFCQARVVFCHTVKKTPSKFERGEAYDYSSELYLTPDFR